MVSFSVMNKSVLNLFKNWLATNRVVVTDSPTLKQETRVHLSKISLSSANVFIT